MLMWPTRDTHKTVITSLLEFELQLTPTGPFAQNQCLQVGLGDDMPARKRRKSLSREAGEQLVNDVGHLDATSVGFTVASD